MNKGQQILAAMLAIVIVVLGLVAFAPQPKPPTVVGGATVYNGSNPHFVYRFWSDGMVDVTIVPYEATDFCTLPSPFAAEPCTVVLVEP